MTRTLALAVAVALMRFDAPGATPQARPTPPPTLSGNRAAIGGRDVSRYEVMYGSPEFRGLDDEESRPWPTRQAIRTIGQLEPIPGRGKRGQGSARPTAGQTTGQTAGRRREWDSDVALHEICRGRWCLAIVPV